MTNIVESLYPLLDISKVSHRFRRNGCRSQQAQVDTNYSLQGTGQGKIPAPLDVDIVVILFIHLTLWTL